MVYLKKFIEKSANGGVDKKPETELAAVFLA
jgi:hypothetical protein